MGVSSMIIDNVKEFQPMMSHSVYALYIYIFGITCVHVCSLQSVKRLTNRDQVSEMADQLRPNLPYGFTLTQGMFSQVNIKDSKTTGAVKTAVNAAGVRMEAPQAPIQSVQRKCNTASHIVICVIKMVHSNDLAMFYSLSDMWQSLIEWRFRF